MTRKKYLLILFLIILLSPLIARWLIQTPAPTQLKKALFGIGYLVLTFIPFLTLTVESKDHLRYTGSTTKSSLVKCLFLTQNYEPSATQYIKNLLKPGDVFVDVGANEGYFTLLAAQCGAYVHAFEPSPSNASLLRKNIKINNYENKVKVHEVAADSKSGTVTFSENRFNGMWSSVGSGRTNFWSTPLTVTKGRVTKFIPSSHLHKIRLIKIDVEGLEYRVLKGIKSFITKYKNNIHYIVEGSVSDPQTSKIFKIFRKNKYDIWGFRLDSATFDPNNLSKLIPEHQFQYQGMYNFVFIPKK